ncbi:NAD(P)-dependent oxidoreductase, partial [Streptomyces sp. NPDC002143]
MKIVVLGATGNIGSHVVKEALSQGHEVVAYVRNPDAVQPQAGVTVVQGSLDDRAALAKAFAGGDAVISEPRPRRPGRRPRSPRRLRHR